MKADYANFANPVAEVWADALGFAVLRWKPGPRSFPEFQEAMNALLCLIRTLGTGKALAILTGMAPITAEEYQWVLTHWLPRAVVQGQCRYAALVNPTDDIDWQSEVSSRYYTSLPPEYETFADEEAARDWLVRQVVIQSRY
ncbi:hypothetical protein D3Y59_02415 [Hymenobacter oligotrophus]|uniref:STAS/SEC14 domain-containing protein n=1 Tax=Hymenobacter oligotrophus TaxID=2319843 RepID=A0A3B7R3U2_9BACT|nr:hypothetical protein [Hymenobacter oligotrophus]AYA36009.1 hypothetical protein D3Y59_02415 [Hymenobacter oligotrophus]